MFPSRPKQLRKSPQIKSISSLTIPSEAWPKERGEVPTPRAISERIITIKKILKKNNPGALDDSKGPKRQTTLSPTKTRVTKPTTPRKKKLKRSVSFTSSEDEQVKTPPETPSKIKRVKREKGVEYDDMSGSEYGASHYVIIVLCFLRLCLWPRLCLCLEDCGGSLVLWSFGAVQRSAWQGITSVALEIVNAMALLLSGNLILENK